MIYQLSNRNIIELKQNPLGKGGEGEVYEITNPPNYHSKVAKIFFKDKRTQERKQKLEYLIHNPPQIEDNGHIFLIWPLELIYENNDFVGFVMPKAEGIDLEVLGDDSFLQYPEYQNLGWEKFAFSNPNFMIIRLQIAYNVCAAVAAVHAKKEYVLVDLKPTNIKINQQGLISIIDLDSIQVVKNGRLLYSSKVATPEYSPPEANNTNVKKESWDRFSLAVILYRILVGIHPFSGTLKPPHDNLTLFQDLIQKGFYPHGKNKDKFEKIHDAHYLLQRYSPEINEMFKKVFDDYLFQPDQRPSAKEWANVLTIKPEINSFQADKNFVLYNDFVKLSWKVKNVSKLELFTNNVKNDVTGLDSIDVTINQPTKFILRAENNFGTTISQPVNVGFLNIKVPNSIFVPTPNNIKLSTHIPNIKGLKQLPSINFPSFNTPRTNINPNLLLKNKYSFELRANGKRSMLQRLKDNYLWTKTLLDNSNYQLSFQEFISYKIYQWALQIYSFVQNLRNKRNDKN